MPRMMFTANIAAATTTQVKSAMYSEILIRAPPKRRRTENAIVLTTAETTVDVATTVMIRLVLRSREPAVRRSRMQWHRLLHAQKLPAELHVPTSTHLSVADYRAEQRRRESLVRPTRKQLRECIKRESKTGWLPIHLSPSHPTLVGHLAVAGTMARLLARQTLVFRPEPVRTHEKCIKCRARQVAYMARLRLVMS